MSKLPTLANNVPINITALKVILPGVSYDVTVDPKLLHYKAQPPLRRPDSAMLNDPNFVDYTGTRWGRWIVVGLSTEYRKESFCRAFEVAGAISFERKKRANGGLCRWVVRCDCGDYELKSVKQIKKAHALDRCYICKSVLNLKKRDFYQRFGRNPTKEEMIAW